MIGEKNTGTYQAPLDSELNSMHTKAFSVQKFQNNILDIS